MEVLIKIIGTLFAVLLFSLRSDGVYFESQLQEPGYYEENLSTLLEYAFRSPYCNISETAMEIGCYYENTNQTIQLLPESEGPLLKFAIHNPNRLILYPVCVSWLTIHDASYITTKSPIKKSLSECSSWLTIINSTVDSLSHGIHDLTLRDSNASHIYLKDQRDFLSDNSVIEHLEWLDWEGYKGKITSSNITTISHLSTSEILDIKNSSYIGTVEYQGMVFDHGVLSIRDSIVDTVNTNGVSVINGQLSLDNVTIMTGHQRAFVVDTFTKVHLKNVDVVKAYKPVFVFPILQNVELENVRINGQELHSYDEWIESNESGEDIISIGMEGCSQPTLDQLECDFRESTLGTFLHTQNLDGISTVTIKNAPLLSINHQNCEVTNITILDSTLNQITGQTSNSSSSNQPCRTSLLVQSSSVETIAVSTFDSINLRNVNVESVEMFNMSKFIFENLSINLIKDLNSAHLSEGSMVNCSIQVIEMATLQGPLYMTNSSISEVKHLVFDHTSKTSNITGVTFYLLRHKSIVVTSGHLHMEEIGFMSLGYESIFLAVNGTLILKNQRRLPPWSERFISVMNKNQAILSFSILDHRPYEWYLAFRNESEVLEDKEEEKEAFINKYVVNDTNTPTPFCISPQFSTGCDFKDTNASVLVRYVSSEPHLLILGNISHLTLHPMCVSRVILTNIKDGRILASDLCQSTMKIDDSSFTEIRIGFRELIFYSSSVGVFAPKTEVKSSRFLRSNLSLVDGVVSKEYLFMERSFVDVIRRLVLEEESTFTHSQIASVEEMAILGKKHKITDCVIGTVKEKGITILGELHLVNTVITEVETFGFDVQGSLWLKNVSILSAPDKFFNLQLSGSIHSENVTINGRSANLEVIFKYVHKTVDKTVVSSTTSPSEQTTLLKDQPKEDISLKTFHGWSTSTRILNHTSMSTQEHSTLPSKDDVKTSFIETGHATNYKLSWLGAILGFFTGVCLTLLALYALYVVRPGTKIQLPLNVRWYGREDSHELVSWDEEEMTDRRTELY